MCFPPIFQPWGVHSMALVVLVHASRCDLNLADPSASLPKFLHTSFLKILLNSEFLKKNPQILNFFSNPQILHYSGMIPEDLDNFWVKYIHKKPFDDM